MKVLFVFSLFALISCKELGDLIDYEKPVIEELTLSKTTVNTSDTVVATVKATNPEKGSLTYAWEAPDGGRFLPPTNEESVQWIAPTVGKVCRIRSVVSNDKKATKSAEVTVRSYLKPVIEGLTLSQNIVIPGDTVVATVTATNPEKGILTYSWQAPDGGQFIPPTNANTVKWIAPFIGKVYKIKAIVSNEETSTRTAEVTVQSLNNPFVQILSPSNNDYFVQMQQIRVDVSAYHDNHLSKVWLLLDNVYIDSLGWNSSNIYVFDFKPDLSVVGQVELKVIAEVFNQPGNTASDYVMINIEGILPKTGTP